MFVRDLIRQRRGVIVIAVAALAGSLATAGAADARPAAPVAAESCVQGVERVECGEVIVPLRRDRPRAGTTRVAYALVRHSNAAVPSAGVLAVNPGGPGGAIIDDGAGYVQALGALLIDHDLLLVDPRGTGRSQHVSCGLSELPVTRKAVIAGAEACGRALGERARAYTTAETVDDIDAVRARLGIDKLDLLGESYGTYLMTVYAQRHPDRVRSIVLSSAYPLAFDMWARPNARAAVRGLKIVCARSGRCDPDVTVGRLATVARRLRLHPVAYGRGAQRRVLDETALAGIVYTAATDGAALGQVPAVLTAAARGDMGPLVAAARAVNPISGSLAGDDGPDLALTIAIVCNDYPTLWSRNASNTARLVQYARARATLDNDATWPFSVRAWTSAIVDRGNTCIQWPDRRGRGQPTHLPLPDVPVLVLSGDLDANVPTEEGFQSAAQFVNARVIEVPNVGHVPEREPSGCVASLIVAFVRTLDDVNTSCLAAIPPVPVV